MHWLSNGAQPTDTVRSLLRGKGLWLKWTLIKQGADEAKIASEIAAWEKVQEDKHTRIAEKQAKAAEENRKKKEAEVKATEEASAAETAMAAEAVAETAEAVTETAEENAADEASPDAETETKE